MAQERLIVILTALPDLEAAWKILKEGFSFVCAGMGMTL